MEYYDISPLISEKTAVFPGDRSFSRQIQRNPAENYLELSSITTTLHIGAHADAPCHYHPQGENIATRKLDYYLGNCQVIDITTKTNQITPSQLESICIQEKRILFKTRSFPNPEKWQNDFITLAPTVIEMLAKQKVILVGIDTPSIDPANSKTLDCHQKVYQYNMAILEGLILEEVPAGIYQLIALPLKIANADASPVRAILIPIPLENAKFVKRLNLF